MAKPRAGSHLGPGEVGTQVLREIGGRLTRIRGQETQLAFAETIGLHKNTLGTYERGEREIGAEALGRIAAAGWNTNWLLTGEGPERLDAIDSGTDVAPGSHDLSEEHLTIALEFADRAIGVGWLPRPLYSRLVRLLYQGVSQGLPTAQIEQFAIAAARQMAQGDNADGSKQGVGPAG